MGYENSAGLGVRNHYGPKLMNEKFGGITTTGGAVKQAEWVFSYDDLPVNGTGDMEALIPAGSYINKAWIEVVTAMAGTSGTLTVGLEEPDGTIIDVDGIDVAVAQAALVANAWIDCNGALVDSGIGVDAQLLVSTGGTVTAGEFRVVVEYIQGDKDNSGRYTAGGTRA